MEKLIRPLFALGFILLLLSGCLSPMADTQPANSKTFGQNNASVVMPIICMASKQDGVLLEFTYPDTGKETSFETPEGTLRFDLDHSGSNVLVTTSARAKTTDAYVKSPSATSYADRETISSLYSVTETDAVTNTEATTVWHIRCGENDSTIRLSNSDNTTANAAH